MELRPIHDETPNMVAKVQVTVTFDIDELRLKASGDDEAKSRAEELISKLLEELLCNPVIDADDLTCEVTVKELEEPCPSFCTEYEVLDVFMDYFINGNDEQLSYSEMRAARTLEDQLDGNKGHWSYPCTEANQQASFTSCDLTGVHGDCVKLWWVDMEEVMRQSQEKDKARAEEEAR